MVLRSFRRDERGISAVEFGLLAPVLITFIIGIAQMGRLFFVNSDMRGAIAAGARVASVWPVPDHAQIEAAVDQRLVRTGAEAASDITITDGAEADGTPFIDIAMDYRVSLDFVFFKIGPITLNDSRRVYVQRESSTTTDGTTSSTPEPAPAPDAPAPVDPTPPPPLPPAAEPPPPPPPPTTPPSGGSNPGNGGSNGNNNGHNHGTCRRRC
jgi:Flp pilus assembly protein TadG